MNLPKTIRLDSSDVNVFPRAAEPGEWAVTGTSAFVGTRPEDLAPKDRQAFRNGWLGTASLGFATLVRVGAVPDDARDTVERTLAGHLVDAFGAPDLDTALAAAREEVAATAELCADALGEILAIERELGPDGIVERVRVIAPPADGMNAPIAIWRVEEDG